jgi:hypothetical protein
LCPGCLTELASERYYCPRCGVAGGHFHNVYPFDQALGFRPTGLILMGYFLLSTYWIPFFLTRSTGFFWLAIFSLNEKSNAEGAFVPPAQ